MTEVKDWSPTDASNNSAPPNGWPEGMMPSGVNDVGRMMMGAIKREHDAVAAIIGTTAGQVNTTTINATTIVASGNITGNVITGAGINSTGNISASGYIAAGGNVTGANAAFTGNVSVGGYLYIGPNNHYWYDTGGGQLGTDGGIYVPGGSNFSSVTASGGITGSNVHSTGNVSADGSIQASGQVTGSYLYSGGDIDAAGVVHANGNRVISQGGSAPSVTCYNTADGRAWGMWAASNNMNFGTLDGGGNPSRRWVWISDGNGWLLPDTDGGQYCGDAANPWAGVEAYAFYTASSAAAKEDVTPVDTAKCAAIVDQLSPVTYRYKDLADDRVHCGFVAEDVREALTICDAVKADGDKLSLAYQEMIGVLWGAVQQLAARVAQLEEDTHV